MMPRRWHSSRAASFLFVAGSRAAKGLAIPKSSKPAIPSRALNPEATVKEATAPASSAEPKPRAKVHASSISRSHHPTCAFLISEGRNPPN